MPEFPVIPGYKIDRELGQGGMARVYLAHEEKLERHVALKVLLPSLAETPNAAERFLKEARTAGKLRHNGIITIYDVDKHNDTYYMAVEYLEGGSLKDRINAGAMDPSQALAVLSKVVAALDYAHAKGFIHRDIKPDNILFREDGEPVLTDFGIARAMNSTTKLTKTGMSIGTPHYMSPEQARSKQLDGRSDLYSLGIVLFEMLTGKVPFDAEDSVAIAIQHIQEPVPMIPYELAQYQSLLDKLLAKNPADRFQTAGQLRESIDGMISGTQDIVPKRSEILQTWEPSQQAMVNNSINDFSLSDNLRKDKGQLIQTSQDQLSKPERISEFPAKKNKTILVLVILFLILFPLNILLRNIGLEINLWHLIGKYWPFIFIYIGLKYTYLNLKRILKHEK